MKSLKGRKADFDIIMLVVAVVCGLLVLVIGLQLTKLGQKGGESVGSEFSVTESVAYGQLKLKCGLWADSIKACVDGVCNADCPNCIESFKSDTLKIYSIPYYVRNARLVNSTYFDPLNSVETKKCDEGAGLAQSPEGEAAQAVLDISDAIENDPQQAARIAEACAYVCQWVTDRGDECKVSAKACGDQVITGGSGVPYFLMMK
jgi:hypothetical protein